MTTYKEHFMTSICCGPICLPKISKASKPQFKTRQEGNIQEAESHPLPDWLAKFTEFMQATGQPNAGSSSAAAHSQNESPSLEDQRRYVIRDQWEIAEPIYKSCPELKTVGLNFDGDTVLHLAVSLNRISFMKGLVALMAPKELEVRNLFGKTAFFMCTNLGNVKFAEIMLQKNKSLAMINGIHGIHGILFPIHVAALHGHRKMLQLLCSDTVLDDLQFNHIVKLFFTTLENNIFDVAYSLLEKRPRLAASRNKDDLTPLHVLARKPEKEVSAGFRRWGHLLIHRLWTAAKFMGHDEMLDLIEKPSNILFDAARSGNIIILDLVYQSNPGLLLHEEQSRTLLDTVVLSRQKNVITHLTKNKSIVLGVDFLMLNVDVDGNNILHLSGKLPPRESWTSSRPHIQLQRELLWFKGMENRVPTALKTMRNRDGLTPKDVFDKQHETLLSEAGVAAKDTANYGMLVATIIATIVFAASLTTPPSYDVSPGADSSILHRKGWYIVFVLSNSIALFSSSSSIIFFLSVLTSSFSKDEFISSLHVRLTFGVTTLFVATTAMVVAFTAACFLIFNHLFTWVAYLVASLGFLTVALFVLVLCTLFGDLVLSFYLSLNFLWPANHYITAFIRMMKGLALKIPNKLLKMCQIPKAKKRLQEDNSV